MGCIIFGDHKQARRVLVQPMHNAGASHAANSRKVVTKVIQKSVHKRTTPISACRVHDHTGRFVDDADIIIFIDDREGDVFRFGICVLRGRNFYLIYMFWFDPVVRLFYVAPLERHMPGFYQFFISGPAKLG